MSFQAQPVYAANLSNAWLDPQYVPLGIHNHDALAGTNRGHVTVSGAIPFHVEPSHSVVVDLFSKSTMMLFRNSAELPYA